MLTEEIESALEEQQGYKVPAIDPKLNEALWRQGVLYHLLDPLQQKIYRHHYQIDPAVKKAVSMISRRVGKTFTYSTIAIEKALRKPGSVQQYVAATQVQVRTMLLPTFQTILASCPEDLQPMYHRQDGLFKFKHNGSVIMMGGAEDTLKADRMRGAFSDNFWIDEAGYIEVLRYLVDSIALPMLHGRGDGAKVTMYSNAPRSPAHDMIGYVNQAKADDAYFHATIYNSPRYSERDIAENMHAAGGRDSTAWLREFMCEVVVDEEYSVLPEFSARHEGPWVQVPESFRARPPEPTDDEADIRPSLVREVERPKYFDIYTTMDLGWSPDLTSVLAMYWDYLENRLVVENELELSKMTTDDLAKGVRELEESTWGEYWDLQRKLHGRFERRPYMRVMDVDRQIQHDLGALHGLEFARASNTDLHSQINRLRQLIRRGGLVVHPKCTNLINHLRAAYWNNARTKFARPKTEAVPGEIYYGHFDHVSALQLGYSHVNQNHDPYPSVPEDFRPSTQRLHKSLRGGRPVRQDGWGKLAALMQGRRRGSHPWK